MKRDAIRDAGLRELGANLRLNKIAKDDRGCPRPYEDRCKLMEDYKTELKALHRKTALECHPDRNMEASEGVRAERSKRFNMITRAVNFLMTLEPQQPTAPPQPQAFNLRNPPPRQGFAVIINMGPRGMGIHDLRFGSGTTNSGTTTSGNHWPWHG